MIASVTRSVSRLASRSVMLHDETRAKGSAIEPRQLHDRVRCVRSERLRRVRRNRHDHLFLRVVDSRLTAYKRYGSSG